MSFIHLKYLLTEIDTVSMKLIKKSITGIVLGALLFIGGFGLTVQSNAGATGASRSFAGAVQLHTEANAAKCIRAENRNCGWFSCWCEGPTTRECAGCGNERVK